MNGTYLSLWLREVSEQLSGSYIDGIQIRERILQVEFSTRSLYVSLYPECTTVYLAKRLREGYVPLNQFKTIVRGLRIERVTQESLKPVIAIYLHAHSPRKPKPVTLTIYLYREAPNVVVHDGAVYRKVYSRIVDKESRNLLWDLPSEQLSALFTRDRKTGSDLVALYEGIDHTLARELDAANARRLQDIVYGRTKANPRLVSTQPLAISYFAERYIDEYASLNTLLQDATARYVEALRKIKVEVERKRVIRNLKRRIERLRTKILSHNDVERYRLSGEAILSNLHTIKKGDEQAILPSGSDATVIKIPLDPMKSPQENAQNYFRTYKKVKRGQPQLQQKIEQLQKELSVVQDNTWKPRASQSKERGKGGTKSPFRHFPLPGGSDVFVGKNARSNMELTFSFAKPHDYFFHVRGYQGSHVILRTAAKKGQQAAKKDITAAASIAAYYSKAKKQRRVPVSYTQRKYLKKGRKGKPGTVILMREDVVFVDPGLPVQSS
jgi:predicted ribosome quality control (RQC) complex YloA/Tae2 family protein